jgi:glycosyltransferase involved in cell wall biosynthesis
MERLKILTWHIHGSYLYYLSQIPHDIYLPVKKTRPMGYGGRTLSYPWPDNIKEIPAEEVRHQDFDCILYQHHQNWLVDQYEILSNEQLKLPRIFLEHNPPFTPPNETRHPVQDRDVLIVHVTAFNQLTWDNGASPTRVIEHGVVVPEDVKYIGDLDRGITVVNNISTRGRKTGYDVFQKARDTAALDLIGMGWKEAGGLCEVRHADLARFCSRYRYSFSPIRYSSLALSTCETMMVGLPVVGLATTEMVTVIENGFSGYLHTKMDQLTEVMKELTNNPALARHLGEGARKTALERFSIERFIRDWNDALFEVTNRPRPSQQRPSLVSVENSIPKLRIAMISEHASPICSPGSVDCGGQNVYVANVARQLALRGHKVDVFTRRDSPNWPEIVDWCPGVRVIHVPAGPARFVKKEDMLAHMNDFTDYMESFIRFQKEPYDLMHANFWMSGIVAADLKQRLEIPFAITFHALGRVRRLHQGQADGFSEDRFQAEDRIVNEADSILAECPQDFEDLKTYYGADPMKITIVPCGFDSDEIYPIDPKVARHHLGLDPELKIALQLGRMVPRKGVDFAIRGFARALQSQTFKGQLLIVGGESEDPDPLMTPEISRLRKVAVEEGINQHVHFFGRSDRDQLKFLYSAADVFLTTPWYEPFGITPLEAMACGTPVIGTRVGGIKFSVVDRETGFLVSDHNPEALADRMIKVFTQPELRQKFSNNSLRRARSLFTWREVSEQIEKVFETLTTFQVSKRRKVYPSYYLNNQHHLYHQGGNHESHNSFER